MDRNVLGRIVAREVTDCTDEEHQEETLHGPERHQDTLEPCRRLGLLWFQLSGGHAGGAELSTKVAVMTCFEYPNERDGDPVCHNSLCFN